MVPCHFGSILDVLFRGYQLICLHISLEEFLGILLRLILAKEAPQLSVFVNKADEEIGSL